MKDGWFMRGMYNLFKYSNDNITALNQSKYFTGLMIIIINMAPRFMTVKLNKTLESYIRYSLNRNVLIFAILWMGTRDIVAALILTAVFTILTQYLFHEDSRLCILPKQLRQLKKSIDVNNDNVLSQDEINRAIRILSEANNKNQSNHR